MSSGQEKIQIILLTIIYLILWCGYLFVYLLDLIHITLVYV